MLRRVAVLAVEADDAAREVDQAMSDADDGPCVESFHTARSFFTTSASWPTYPRTGTCASCPNS
jgi:hypothetical protein